MFKVEVPTGEISVELILKGDVNLCRETVQTSDKEMLNPINWELRQKDYAHVLEDPKAILACYEEYVCKVQK